MPAPILQVKEVSFTAPGGFRLHPVSFQLEQGVRLAIAGETGSGKSTLLKMIGGLVQPASGHILFNQERVPGPEEQLIPGHKGIAYLSQHYELRNNYTVFDLLDYGSELEPAEAQMLFRICEIDHLLQRKTNSGLSGGEKQRIALAKLLATKPRMLLLDEPFSNLDALHRKSIKQVLHNISAQLKITTILVSHDAADTLSWANHIMVLRGGRLIQAGTPQTIYHQPAQPYVAGLFGTCNLLQQTWLLQHLPMASHLPAASLYMIRPEAVRVQPGTDERGLTGRVTDCLFYGPHYMAVVEAAGTRLEALVHHPLPPHTAVTITLPPDHLHPMLDEGQ
jgi:iron(III) transport system ATP-binding protein